MATKAAVSTNSDAGYGDVSLSELVAALPGEASLAPEYLEHFSAGNTLDEEKKTKPEDAVVAEEGAEAVVEGEETPEAAEGDEPKVEGDKEVKEGEEEAKEGDEEKDPESGLPLSVQKRIDKLTAEKYAAKEELDALKAENTALKAKVQAPVVVQPTPDNPLANVHSYADLAAQEAQFKSVKRFCMSNPDGGTVTGTDKDGKPTETFISPERVRELLIQADELLTERIPQRRQYLEQAAAFSNEAKVEYPDLFKDGSEDGKLAVQFVNMAPWVRNFPDWQVVIGDYISGMKGRMARKDSAKAATKKAVPAVKPLGAPKPAAGGTKVSASKKSLHSVIGERDGNISVQDAADLLSGMF